MHVAHLSLVDYRSYESLELDLRPGTTTFVGLNGQGKTNLVEAIGYVATLAATASPGTRPWSARALPGPWCAPSWCAVAAGPSSSWRSPPEGEPGAAEPQPGPPDPGRPGVLRTVLFAPEDLALVKGDPTERRRYLDELLVTRWPRVAGVRADYDRVLRQRGALLKSAGARCARAAPTPTPSTCGTSTSRVGVRAALGPARAAGRPAGAGRRGVPVRQQGAGRPGAGYRSSLPLLAEGVATTPAARCRARRSCGRRSCADGRAAQGRARPRGVPRRPAPRRPRADPGRDARQGYASHGESWSVGGAALGCGRPLPPAAGGRRPRGPGRSGARPRRRLRRARRRPARAVVRGRADAEQVS